MEMTIQEAALHLNVSVNTIRRRLLTGALTGTKVGTRWVLTINGNGPAREGIGPAREGIDSQVEILWLREQLETRTREVAELHQLLAAHSLNPGHTTTPWWAFWR